MFLSLTHTAHSSSLHLSGIVHTAEKQIYSIYKTDLIDVVVATDNDLI